MGAFRGKGFKPPPKSRGGTARRVAAAVAASSGSGDEAEADTEEEVEEEEEEQQEQEQEPQEVDGEAQDAARQQPQRCARSLEILLPRVLHLRPRLALLHT